MRPRTNGSIATRLCLGVVLALTVACNREQAEPAGDSPSASIAPPEGVRQMLLAEVAHYEFDADSACVAATGSVLETNRGTVPSSVQYASARLTDAGAHQSGRIIGRITSSAAYPALGIVTGVNYVWRDSADGSYRLLVVPDSVGTEMTWLALGREQYVVGPVTGLRCAVNRSIGVCGGGCGPGHCPSEAALRVLVVADSSSIRVHP